MFPTSPILNQLHTEGSIAYKYNGCAWEYNTIVKIDNAMLLEIAPLLSIDIEQFFIDASKL